MSVHTAPHTFHEQPVNTIDKLQASSIHCVREALIESRLIEALLDFRGLGLASVGLPKTDEKTRVQSMLELKKASEKFNQLLKPVDERKLNAIRKFNLEPLMSNRYWHALFLECSQPGQGESTLNKLYAKLLSALKNLPVDVQSTNNPKAAESKRYGLAVSGFVAGASLLSLFWLAHSAFWSQLPVNFSLLLPGSTLYRLVMIVVLFVFTVSIFLMISKISEPGYKSYTVVASASKQPNLLADVFDIGASPRRVFVGALGPILLGLGSGISISAGFGTFGFSVLLDGLYKTFQFPFWLSQSVITLACYCLAWVWGRVPLGLGTLTTLLLIGPAISFGVGIPPENLSFLGNLFAFFVGLLLFALGISCAAAAALGPDGITALSLAAERKHDWPVPRATFLWDSTAIAAGIILGGNFGIATLIGLIMIPYLIHLFIPRLRRILY